MEVVSTGVDPASLTLEFQLVQNERVLVYGTSDGKMEHEMETGILREFIRITLILEPPIP